MSVDDNQEVNLLIDANCVCALEPRELVSSQNGTPYAFKIILGWCILGPMINQTKASQFGCNRIMLASADTVKPIRHYFTGPTKVRETSTENMLETFYEHESVEPELQYSVNNK